MLHSVREFETFKISASDGVIGHVKDVYFDDAAWVARYLVVSTGAWLSGREVLISPFSVGTINHVDKLLPVSISREQVKNSPSVDTDKPVSRQHESAYLGYYGYPAYWGGVGVWGMGSYPGAMLGAASFAGSDIAYSRALAAEESRDVARVKRQHASEDAHLRSCNQVKGYHIHATDGEIGHVGGFLIDEHSWTIQYLVVDTSNWWLGHEVLIAPEWIEDVSWLNSTVKIDLTRAQIQASPPYNSGLALARRNEEALYGHYGRQGYWHDDTKRAVA